MEFKIPKNEINDMAKEIAGLNITINEQHKEIEELKEENAIARATIYELEKYKKGFHILMEYYDSISDEEKPKVDRELEKIGL